MFQTKFNKKAFAGVYLAVLFAFLLSFFNFPVARAADANIYFSPSSGSFKVGQSFTVGVYVSSVSQAMNAASGTIAYSSDTLAVTNVSKSGSIISLWTRDPANSGGSVVFEGIVLNPGYQGSGGKLISITFKVKAPGNAALRFISGTVLANDGLGTNIVSGLGSASYDIQGSDTTPTDNTPAVSTGLPKAPRVTSATHPDSDSWYADPNPTFQWTLPSGITAVNFFGDQKPDTDPGIVSDGIKSNYAYNDVADGIWYFHLKLKNSQGWGPITHFRFQIDTVNPSSVDASVLDGPARKFSIKASDATSGIDHYELKFDSTAAQTWKDDGSGIYVGKDLAAGAHSLSVKAFDKAGNSLAKTISFDLPAASQTVATPIAASQLFPWILPALKDISYGIVILLLLYALYKLLKKLFGWIATWSLPTIGGVRRKDLIESIEILERAERNRDLTPEEEKVLRNLRELVYGKKPKTHVSSHSHPGEKIVEGIFDGKNMIGGDGQIYSVPANYASKSKMIEGDQLRLSIHKDGSMVYKQVGPIERQKKHGILGEQDDGEYRVIAGGKAYKILPASLLFFKAQPGDEVSVLIPKGSDSEWAAIEDVIKHNHADRVPEELPSPAKRYNRKKKKE